MGRVVGVTPRYAIKVMLYWSSLNPRSVDLVSLKPGPLAESPETLGAIFTMRVYSAMGVTDKEI